MSSKKKTTTKEQSQVRPTNPAFVTGAVRDQQQRIDDFASQDPSQFVAGASPLQRAAFGLAAGLAAQTGAGLPAAAAPDVASPAITARGDGSFTAGGSGQGGLLASLGKTTPDFSTTGAAPQTGGANAFGLFGQAANLANSAGTAGPNYVQNASLASAPNVSASTVAANSVNLPGLGDPATFQAATISDQLPAILENYQRTAGSAGGASVNAGQVNVNDLERAQAASTLDTYQDFLSPYTDQVVDASLATFDDSAGQQRAALQAEAARGGAFGGSRFGVTQGQFDADTVRDRGLLSATLRDQALQRAFSFAGDDANRLQQTNLANAGFTNDALGLNANLLNSANIASANNATQASIANASNANRLQLANLDAQLRGLLSDQSSLNQAGLFNAGASNQFALADQDAQLRAALANQDASLRAGLANQSTGLQANLANQNAALQTSLFNAGSINDLNRFNAGQADGAAGRQLQAAGLLGNLGASVGDTQRANIGLLGYLGGIQRGIDQDARNALPTQLNQLANLQAAQNYGLFRGENINSRSEQVQSGGLFESILGGVALAGQLGLGIPSFGASAAPAAATGNMLLVSPPVGRNGQGPI